MRFAGNFNPEWGYLAPAPSFIRTVRIAVVAAAVGATAGAAVVFSLADRPVAEESVAARTLARPADFAPARTQAQAQAKAGTGQGQSAMLSPANAAAVSPSASETGASSTIQRPASIAALAEAPTATAAAPPPAVAPTPAAPSLPKKRAKRHHTGTRPEEAYGDAKGSLALLHLFSARATTGSSWPYE